MPSITAAGLASFLRPIDVDKPTESEFELIDQFNALFPELQGDLFSYMQNKECGCKQRIIAALNRSPEQAEQLVQLVYKDLPPTRPRPTFEITQEDVVDPTTLTSYAGNIVVIDADQAEYRKLIRKLYAERKVYQGLFIEKLYTQWKIFFY
jgi:hypothetical protein